MIMPKTLATRLASSIGAVGLAVCLAGGLATLTTPVAQAAVPDHWGFAFVDKPTVAGIPDPMHQAGSWPAGFFVHSTPGVVGQVIVRFPQIASKGGVVHVTAVNANAVFCQAQKWAPAGPDEVVVVRCFLPGGAPTFSQFSVMFTTSTKGPFPPGRAYGYVHFEPAAGIVATFNSVGAVNTVTPSGAGTWIVTMPGLGTPVLAGGVQVTAVNTAMAAKCEVAAWTSSAAAQRFVVQCFNALSAPLTTGWSLSYQKGRAITGTQPKLFAYTFDNNPANPGPYAPVPPTVNFNSVSAVNTIQRAGVGLRLINFPGVGVLPNTVLVSGFKVGPGFCNMNFLWATFASSASVIVRDVACYTFSGTPINEPSLISYTSSH